MVSILLFFIRKLNKELNYPYGPVLYIHGKMQNVKFGCKIYIMTYKHPYIVIYVNMYFTGYIIHYKYVLFM
jgi:hypothetical protein